MHILLRFLFILLLIAPLPARAQNITPTATTFDYAAFRTIPILHDGRVKPLASFARIYLTAFYGKSSLSNMSADAWLAELLFDPASNFNRPLFNIPNPEVASALSLPLRNNHFYSYNEVSKAINASQNTVKAVLAIDEATHTNAQRQLIDLCDKAVAYLLISQSLSILQPHFKIDDARLAAQLHLPAAQKLTFLDILPHEHALQNYAKILKDKKSPPQSDFVKLIADFTETAQQQHSTLLRIVPPQWPSDGDTWHAPWPNIMEGHAAPASAAYLALWQDLGIAYLAHDAGEWQKLTQQVNTMAFAIAGPHASEFRQKLEGFYLQSDPFTWALALYIFSFIALLAYLLSHSQFFYRTSALLLSSGLGIHLIALVTRIIIMNRPPVTTLYETTIFVSLIAVLLCLIFEWKRRDSSGLTVGSIIGTVLLFISTRYAAGGDTMEMLVAVLNTNFWLATHVVSVTMGYGCALVAGTLGHVYLLSRWRNPLNTTAHTNILNSILATALIATFFATLGTILGGIWADQSWGRFWGWDPKENGALFVVLWLLWLLHGKISGTLKPLAFATIAVLTNVVVALSWFGVNLLGVGLHSYGFTNHIALNLGLFCGAEILFAGFFYALVKAHDAQKVHA